MNDYSSSKTGQVSKWVQSLVDKEILEYQINPIDGELEVIRGKNYHKAPENFRLLFEGRI